MPKTKFVFLVTINDNAIDPNCLKPLLLLMFKMNNKT